MTFDRSGGAAPCFNAELSCSQAICRACSDGSAPKEATYASGPRVFPGLVRSANLLLEAVLAGCE